MRKGILGSIAALAAGAGAAWGQTPGPVSPAGGPPPPAAIAAPAGEVIQVNGPLLPPGLTPNPPAPVIMPPISVGPPGDPQGLGPVGGFGPPPGPMYPNPGAYAAPQWQPAPPDPTGGSVGQAPHVWTQLDYLLYFNKSMPVNYPLVTTSAPVNNGVLGRPSTLVLAGDGDISWSAFSGFRVTSGFFGDADRRYGFEASGFVVEQKSYINQIFSSPANIPVLARPFLDTANPQTSSTLLIAHPNYASGDVLVKASTMIYGVEANSVTNLYRSAPSSKCAWSLDFLLGYRFLQLQEELSVASASNLDIPDLVVPIFVVGPFGVLTQVGTRTVPVPVQFAGVTIFSPSTVLIQDYFKVTNRFNGGQVGLRSEVRYGMFLVTATGKFAIGNMNQRLEISGASGFIDPTRQQTFGTAFGGLLATSTNIGTYNNDEFTIIPELNLNVGLQLTRSVTAYLGYNFLYINNVARPGSQINPVVNSATVPASPNYGSTTRPAGFRNLFQQDDYWLMGLNFGMQLRY